MEDEVTFLFQLGVLRDAVSCPVRELTLASLKDMAVRFVHEKVPDNGLNRLSERILLFRHDYLSPNVLQLVNSAADITDETLVEIVLTANPLFCGAEAAADSACAARPHSLAVHSYKAPTFCDFCGEMLFGLVRQGLKCEGCGLNYHKRCAVKVPADCPTPVAGASGAAGGAGAAGRGARSPSRGSHEESLLSGSSKRSRSPSRASLAGSLAPHPPTGIPHTFEVHTYTRPTVCRHCKKLLKGLFKQGMQCKDCHYHAHKKCLPYVPKDCAGEPRDSHGEYQDSSGGSEMSERCGDDESDGEEEARDARDARHARRHHAHHAHHAQHTRDLDTEPHRLQDRNSSSSSSPSANIPLMRIVQSVKHTKRAAAAACLKEGWLVHFTNKDATLRCHYWRLDSQSVTLFQSDTGTKYYKEIPLADILSIDTARAPVGDVMHVFSMRTANVDYYVGAVGVAGAGAGAGAAGGAGVGEHCARSWLTALRLAVAPHNAHTATSDHAHHDASPGTSPGSPSPGGERGAGGAEERGTDMAHLYQIHPDEVLGSGQFGVVYGGLHRSTGRPVAIKVIDKLRFPTKQEAALKNEVAILQNICHPGVVNLERMFESPERIFVVMEKLKGDMLEMILSHENGRLDERTTKFLVAQILVALKHLHEKNIVHCDLKPENVLLSEHGQLPLVKLCDFGFARIIGEKSFRRSVVGTPAYLAPEVLRNKGYNRSLDMWSVGVIVYVSLSGTFPFNEDEDIAEQIHNAAFMYPPQPWANVSDEAIDLINNLLQVKQRKRLSVDKSLSHAWLQTRQAWDDLRALEARQGTRYLTHPSDDERWL